MSWFICVLSKKPLLDWEVVIFHQTHPQTEYVVENKNFYLAFAAQKGQFTYRKSDEEESGYYLQLGHGYIAKNTGYCPADLLDWKKLLTQEYAPKDIDGHYVVLKIKPDYVQITNDPLGHYPLYYIKQDDYFVASNCLNYLAPLVSNRTLKYSSFASLALCPFPLVKESLLNKVQLAQSGSTITYHTDRITKSTSKINFLADNSLGGEDYLFYLRKVFDLQLPHLVCMVFPWENSFTSRYAFSVFKDQNPQHWGLAIQQNSTFLPNKFLLSEEALKYQYFLFSPSLNPETIWQNYQSFVLTTGLSDFPVFFDWASSFSSPTGKKIIFHFSKASEWLFAKKPLSKTDFLFNLLKKNSFSAFKSQYVTQNHFFNQEFYSFLLTDLKKMLSRAIQELATTGTVYDQYLFYIENLHLPTFAPSLVWLNNFHHFYSPGLLYSFVCRHVLQRLTNPHFYQKKQDNIPFFNPNLKKYPQVRKEKWTLLNMPHRNEEFFPLIEHKVGEMLAQANSVAYYDFKALVKLFGRAKKKNTQAISLILKWTACEIWRKAIE